MLSIKFVMLCRFGGWSDERGACWSELIFLDFLGEMGCNLRA